jgi:hypothetical protein
MRSSAFDSSFGFVVNLRVGQSTSGAPSGLELARAMGIVIIGATTITPTAGIAG